MVLLLSLNLIPLLLLMTFGAFEAREREAQYLENSLESKIRYDIQLERELVENARTILRLLSNLHEINSFDIGAGTETLRKVDREFSRYTNFGLINLDGQVIFSSTPIPDHVHFKNENFWRRAIQNQGFSSSGCHIDPETGNPIAHFGYPVFSNSGNLKGVVFANLDYLYLNKLEQAAASQSSIASDFITLNDDGIVLAYSPGVGEHIGQLLSNHILSKQVFNTPKGLVEGHDKSGRAYVYAFNTMQSVLFNDKIVVIAAVPKAELYAQANLIWKRNIAALLVIFILTLIVGWVSSRRLILGPIRYLSATVRRLAAGNFASRVEVRYPGVTELAELMSTFNQMVASLEHHETERKQAENAMENYATRLKTLYKINQAILRAESAEMVSDAVLNHISDVISCVRTSIALFDQDQQEVVSLNVLVDRDKQLRIENSVPSDLFRNRESLKNGEPFQVEDIDQMTSLQVIHELKAVGVRSYVNVPILAQGQLLGTLNIGSAAPGRFNEEDLRIARELANSLAIAFRQNRLFQRLRESQERLQRLSRHLMQIQENERRVIARELHDDIGQTLAFIQFGLGRLSEAVHNEDAEQLLADCSSSMAAAIETVRSMALNLRPAVLDDLGLIPALRWLVDQQTRRAGFIAHFEADPQEISLPSEIETTCFRVAQESLSNILRHARAKQVWLELHLRLESRNLLLMIRDDGIGFNVDNTVRQSRSDGTSLGLIGMQERVELAGGQIEIHSSPGGGTEVRLIFSIDQEMLNHSVE